MVETNARYSLFCITLKAGQLRHGTPEDNYRKDLSLVRHIQMTTHAVLFPNLVSPRRSEMLVYFFDIFYLDGQSPFFEQSTGGGGRDLSNSYSESQIKNNSRDTLLYPLEPFFNILLSQLNYLVTVVKMYNIKTTALQCYMYVHVTANRI